MEGGIPVTDNGGEEAKISAEDLTERFGRFDRESRMQHLLRWRVKERLCWGSSWRLR